MIIEEKKTSMLLAEILELTDLMLNSIKVDAFEVFEKALEDRETCILNLKKAKINNSIADDQEDKVLISKILEVDKAAHSELKSYELRINNEYRQVMQEKSKLAQNQKRTNQYQMIVESDFSGGNFDKKK